MRKLIRRIYMYFKGREIWNAKMFEDLKIRLERLNGNTILFIKTIDRLGRNYADLNEQWRIITKEKGADIVVIDMPLLDTRRKKNLLGTFISDIVLHCCPMLQRMNDLTSGKGRQREL